VWEREPGRVAHTTMGSRLRGRRAAALAAVAVAMMALSTSAEGQQEEQTTRGGGRGRALLGERNHSYKVGEEVKLYANKVGPFHNPR
jgi:hypothetical protein